MSRRTGRLPRLGGVALATAVIGYAALVGLGARASAATAATGTAAYAGEVRQQGFSLATADQATRFIASYSVAADGSVDVVENITWTFPSGQDRHGIYRNITVRAGYQNSTTQYRYYPLSQVAVTSPTGAPTDISLTDEGATVQLRIGSPSQTVTGTQQYLVRYHLDHVVNDIGDGTAEFYYNVIDPANSTPTDNLSASVTAPVAATKAACFYGPSGSTTSCTATAGETSTFTVPNLGADEGASVVTSYPRAAFGDLTPDLRQGNVDTSSGSSISPTAARGLGYLAGGIGILAPLLAAGTMAVLVWKRGRDEQYAGITPGLTPGLGQEVPVVRTSRRPTVAVQFTPPEGVQPGMLGTVLDEEANVVDVTSTLIDLAVRGYLVIEEVEGGHLWTKGDWRLSRTSPPAGGPALNPYEQLLLDSVFAGGPSVTLSSLKNTFAPTLHAVQRLMYDETVVRGWFRSSPETQRGVWVGIGFGVMVASVIAAVLVTTAGGGAFRDAGLPLPPGWVLGIGGVLAGFIVVSLGRRMASRTALGSAVLAQSRGFELYLKTAEANQIKWEEAQDIFSRYLPYAIVFGVAERWAKVFQDVADAASAAGHSIAPPIWYAGQWDAMGFGRLAAGMDSFSTTAAGTFVSTPGSSGGSGFSSGGGFSGGGGGGSSGGSW